MAKKEKSQIVAAKIFAQEYLNNGMNATKAMQALKPNLTYGSARDAGSTALALADKVGAIDSLTASARGQWNKIAQDCIAQLHTIAMGLTESAIAPTDAHKLLIEYGKILAPASAGPKTLTQVNKYLLPKRS